MLYRTRKFCVNVRRVEQFSQSSSRTFWTTWFMPVPTNPLILLNQRAVVIGIPVTQKVSMSFQILMASAWGRFCCMPMKFHPWNNVSFVGVLNFRPLNSVDNESVTGKSCKFALILSLIGSWFKLRDTEKRNSAHLYLGKMPWQYKVSLHTAK